MSDVTIEGADILAGVAISSVTNPQAPGTLPTTAGASFPIGTPVYISSASEALPARANQLATSQAIGLANTGATQGLESTVRFSGTLTASVDQWEQVTGELGLIPGARYYVSSTTAGTLTRTPPGSIGSFVKSVGIAMSPTSMNVGSNRDSMPASGMFALEFLATPVVNSRQWSTALVPDGSGGWNFITQCYNYPNDEPTQWVVDHLEANTYTFDVGPNEIYSNTNFQINTALQANGPMIAANGRVFFPSSSTPDATKVNVPYYSPSDQHVHQLQFANPNIGNDTSAVFSGVFNHSGDTMYFGTQSAVSQAPFVFSIDPVTLAYTAIALVGVPSVVNPNYAYYLAADNGVSPYLYVAVGQDTWQLVSIDLNTNTPTILYTTAGPGEQFMQFDPQPTFGTQGWRVTIIDNGVESFHWIADGALSAWPGSGSPPGGGRNVTPYATVLVDPPDVDFNIGAGFVAWRPFGSSGDFTVNSYPVTIKDPQPIESLITLPAPFSNVVFGDTVQYNGFWNYDTDTDTVTWFGPGDLALLSQPALDVVSPLVYMSGYANGALYSYDPSMPWTPLNPGGNPTLLGNFHDTGSFMKYCYFLERSAFNGLLYACGRRERDGVGSGVGSYDIATTVFTGNVNAPLPSYDPRGWLVLDDFGAIVFSGRSIDGVTDAQFVILDYTLAVTGTQTARAGVIDTGLIYSTAVSGVIVGVSQGAGAVYKYDLNTATMLEWVPQTGLGSESSSKAPDGSIWFISGDTLKRIDPATFAITTIGTFLIGIDPTSSFTTWIGGDLYLANDSDLYFVNL